MARKPFPPNNYCPCGSNKKYRNCCRLRGVDIFIKPNGRIITLSPLNPEERQAFEARRQEFVVLNGRTPTAEEEAILRSQTFESVEAVVEKELISRGAGPAEIYAYRKTGIMVCREDRQSIAPDELRAWEDAIQEYKLNQAL